MSKAYKKFVPSIYLYQGRAVPSLRDHTVVDDDPLRLAMSYNNGTADELLIFDQSRNDAEHDQAIDMIRSICENVRIPVTGAGHIRRLEDVKKLLYAGCRKAALNFSREDNVELAAEAAARFGRDKIAACCLATDAVLGNQELILKNVSRLYYVDGIDRTPWHKVPRVDGIETIAVLEEISDEDMAVLMNMKGIGGVGGNAVNDRISRILGIKKEMEEKHIPVRMRKAVYPWSAFVKNSDGLLPVVVQDAATDQVLMVAYMNEEAYEHTILSGKMTYWSRSRKELWVKGDTSGHYQYVRSLTGDCDMDTLLARVDQVGAACHTGSHTCFFNEDLADTDPRSHNPGKVLERDYQTILDRRANPKEGSYTNYLFDKGLDKMLKKLGEENTEIIIAAKNPGSNEIIYEIADYLYHLMVVMADRNVSWDDIMEELARRQAH